MNSFLSGEGNTSQEKADEIIFFEAHFIPYLFPQF
jgi:hypothetical protein